MKTVCIILLNWNNCADTINCIESLKSLNYPYRLQVVDNGSTDDSVNQLQTTFPELSMICNPHNLGFGGGCNIGIQQALLDGAQYIWLLNNDTTVAADTLSALVDVADADQDIGAVGSVLYFMNDPGRIQAWGGGYINNLLGISRHYLEKTDDRLIEYLTGASLLLRADAIKEVGIFDEKFFMYWEDADLCFRLRKAGWKLATAKNAKLLHKESASLGKKSIALNTYFSASSVRFFRKHVRFSIVPITISTTIRLLRRLLRGDFHLVAAVWYGVRQGYGC